MSKAKKSPDAAKDYRIVRQVFEAGQKVFHEHKLIPATHDSEGRPFKSKTWIYADGGEERKSGNQNS